ncbi:hypothetical protein [Paenibacillus sp. GP183]|uniref:hypothetical protein n=1 Tax=Paenibacillus sp. GP183 TaxID=1882751 RepID=UPI000899ADF5|nr:hypothetical protein [Paenibacillus sp. GP183]SEB54947.1 hypothetical protein SAMN05443246_1015 [Paenibacillus sp. GP183]
MYIEINKKIVAAREQGRLQMIWNERLHNLEEELKEREQQIRMWELQLKKEEEDVEKLKGISFSSFLYTILSKKEERLEHEQMEVLEAKLKHDEASKATAAIRTEIDELKAKLYEVRNCQMALEDATARKELLIEQNDSVTSKKLHELAERRAELEINIKELNEAIAAGKSVSDNLDQAKVALHAATNWGTFDMLGGGLLATHGKHNRLDEAMDYIQNAQKNLGRFEKELQDVHLTLTIELDVNSFLRFSDYFFDGLITDWIVQGRIQNTLAQVESKSSAVNTILWELENERRKCDTELAAVQNAYSSLVETTEDENNV